jgi:NADPH2:quinone reductase
MTNKMKAAVLAAPGGPEALELTEVDLPWPASDRHVLVRLKAAALNPADSFFRAFGPYVEGKGPCILGHDGAGVVEAVGAAVSRVRPGQRVCFCNGGLGGDFGTYAEFAAVPESQLAAVPDGVDDTTAAALPLVLITGWESLYERAQLSVDEFALIHAGAGGTGHIAVQLAALRGARVAATVSSDAKADFVTGLGAERPILYRSEDFAEAARDWTGGRGLDVALDNVGPEAMQKTFTVMAPYGRVVTLMGTPGDDAEETAYVKNLTIHNVMMLTPMLLGLQARLDEQAGIVAEGLRLLAEGQLKVAIDSSFPLEDIAAAHARLDAGGMTGKIVLSIAD